MDAWMKESTTYQAIVEEGRLKQVRKDIRRLGERKFNSAPPAHVQTALEGILNLEELHRLLERILEVGNWDELMPSSAQQPAPRRKRRK